MDDQRFRTSNGEVIKRLRGQKGWSQETLAGMASVSESTVQRAENGERLQIEKIGQIAKSLGVEIVDIVVGGNLAALCPGFAIVPRSDQCATAESADTFYDGFPPTWAELKANFDIERHISGWTNELRETIAGLLQAKGPSMFAITGVAGCGKTTVLHRLGFDNSTAGITVLRLLYDWHESNAPSLTTQLRAVATSVDSPILVLIDNAGDLVFEHPILDSTIRELRLSCRDNTIVIACAEETNRWRAASRRVSALPSAPEFAILHLLESECERLVDTILRLEQTQALTVITSLSRTERLRLCEKLAERQFLVAMLQMRHGKQFRAIIRNEFERIPLPGAQRAYGVICQLNAMNLYPPRRATRVAVGINSGLQITHFEDSTAGLLLHEDGGYRARHSVIAREIADHAFSTPEGRQLGIIEVLRALTPGDEAERRWFIEFFTKPNLHRLLCSLFNKDREVVRNFYEYSRLIIADGGWPSRFVTYVAASEGMSQSRLGDIDRARLCFAEASAADPSYEWPVRQHAWLEHRHGRFKEAGELAQKAAAIAPERFETVSQCARILSTSNIGNFKRARQYFERAMEIDPTNQRLERDWKYYCHAERDLKARRKVLADNEIIPEEVQDRVRPGLAFYRILFGTKDEKFRNRLKLQLRSMEGRVDGEVEDLLEILIGVDLNKNPSLNALYQCNLGRLLYLEWYHKQVPHNPDAMERAFQASLALNPSDPFTHCWNGTFLKEVRKDIESARKEYKEALRLGSKSGGHKLKEHPLFLNNMALLLIHEVQEKMRSSTALMELPGSSLKVSDSRPS